MGEVKREKTRDFQKEGKIFVKNHCILVLKCNTSIVLFFIYFKSLLVWPLKINRFLYFAFFKSIFPFFFLINSSYLPFFLLVKLNFDHLSSSTSKIDFKNKMLIICLFITSTFACETFWSLFVFVWSTLEVRSPFTLEHILLQTKQLWREWVQRFAGRDEYELVLIQKWKKITTNRLKCARVD